MAIGKLPVDYVQDVIDTSVTDKRRYHMITNTDGTMSLDDVTTYLLKGSEFGADNINQTNGAVNEVIDALEDIKDGTTPVTDNTKVSLDKDFVLINQQALTFINNVATVADERITADSLADVYFTGDTIDVAENANILVETYAGKVELTAGKTPEDTIKASIHIRVV